MTVVFVALTWLALAASKTPDTFVYRVTYVNGDTPTIVGPNGRATEIKVLIGDRVRFQPEDPKVATVTGRSATRKVTVTCTTGEKKRSCGFFQTCKDPICSRVSRDVPVEYAPVRLAVVFHPGATIFVSGRTPRAVKTELIADQFSGQACPTVVMPSDGVVEAEPLTCQPGYFWKKKEPLPASEELAEKHEARRIAEEAGEAFCLDMPEQCRYQKKFGKKGCCQIETVEDEVTADGAEIRLTVVITVERWR